MFSELATSGLCRGVRYPQAVDKSVDNFLWVNVVCLTLTRHNEYMTAITQLNTKTIQYANNEWAHWLDNDSLASKTKHSTAINYWNYHLSTGELTVKYHSTDAYYTYTGVPFATMFSLMLADSLGAFMAKEIKPNFPLKGVVS